MLGVAKRCRLLGRNGNVALGTGKSGKETSPRGARGGWSSCRNGAAPGWAGEAPGEVQGYSQLLQDGHLKLLEKHKDIHSCSKLSSRRQELQGELQKCFQE